MQIQSAIPWLSRLITPCDNSTATSNYTQPSIKLPIGNHKVPQIHSHNCPLCFDDLHQKSNMPIQWPTQPPSQPHPNPLIRFGRIMNVDRQRDYGALQCIAERCETLRNTCGTFRCITVLCRNFSEHFRTIAVYCRPLWCIAVICKNIAKGLQTIVVLYSACVAISTPCSGVHEIVIPLAIIAVHCGNVEALQTIGTLPSYCGSLHCIVVQVAHAAVE